LKPINNIEPSSENIIQAAVDDLVAEIDDFKHNSNLKSGGSKSKPISTINKCEHTTAAYYA
jgi:hypothetical protein